MTSDIQAILTVIDHVEQNKGHRWILRDSCIEMIPFLCKNINFEIGPFIFFI